MKLDNIYLVSHKRTQMSEAELANLERCQDYTFPDDLCEFLRKFGAGEYCGCFYILKPEDLLNGQATCREFWSESLSIFFCPKISGYVHVYSESLDIHHDLDFDLEVCRDAEEKFYRLGFRSVEHCRP